MTTANCTSRKRALFIASRVVACLLMVALSACGEKAEEGGVPEQEPHAATKASGLPRAAPKKAETKAILLKAAEKHAPRSTLSLKGLYLGMPIHEAQGVLEELLGYKLLLRQGSGEQPYSVWDPKGETGVVADSRGEVKMIRISSSLSNKLFNAHHLDGRKFKERFCHTYGLKAMKPYEKRVQNIRFPGWRLRLPGGDFLTIYQIKMVELTRGVS